MEYYLPIRNKEILPLLTMWNELEGTVLSQISWKKANIIYSHLYVESKTKQTPPNS